MQVRTLRDIGAAIRERRRTLGLTQAGLAARIGTSRQWIVEVEGGKPRVEAGLLLRTLDDLGLRLSIDDGKPANAPDQAVLPLVDIDQVIADARNRDQG